jgi:hypothetical protein
MFARGSEPILYTKNQNITSLSLLPLGHEDTVEQLLFVNTVTLGNATSTEWQCLAACDKRRE